MTVGETRQPYAHLRIRGAAIKGREFGARWIFGAFAGNRGVL